MDYNRYPELVRFVGIQKTYGIILMVIAVICAAVVFFTLISAGSVLAAIVGAAISIFLGILMMNLAVAIGEFAKVIMDIEENTRRKEGNNG